MGGSRRVLKCSVLEILKKSKFILNFLFRPSAASGAARAGDGAMSTQLHSKQDNRPALCL